MTSTINHTPKSEVLQGIDKEAAQLFSQLSDGNKDEIIDALLGLLAGRGPTLSGLALTG